MKPAKNTRYLLARDTSQGIKYFTRARMWSKDINKARHLPCLDAQIFFKHYKDKYGMELRLRIVNYLGV